MDTQILSIHNNATESAHAKEFLKLLKTTKELAGENWSNELETYLGSAIRCYKPKYLIVTEDLALIKQYPRGKDTETYYAASKNGYFMICFKRK